jgi:hypothetical protein
MAVEMGELIQTVVEAAAQVDMLVMAVMAALVDLVAPVLVAVVVVVVMVGALLEVEAVVELGFLVKALVGLGALHLVVVEPVLVAELGVTVVQNLTVVSF